ncbi:MAG: amino acid permease [Myxococcota bacterium]
MSSAIPPASEAATAPEDDDGGGHGLARVLGPVRATALVVGSIIGTGVFLKPAKMAEAVGSSALVLGAWLVAGALSMAGALTYAELGARLPHAGGEYAYLKTAYGPLPAFMYGWMRFWIGSPGSIASFAVGTTVFLAQPSAFGIDVEAFPGGASGLAVLIIAVLTGVNLLAVGFGAGVQTGLTVLKVVAVVGLGVALFALGRAPDAPVLPTAPLGVAGFSTFVTAVLAALWAFDGWNNLPMVGSEVRRPRRNIPLALVVGMLLVTALYLVADRAYFAVLTPGEVAAASSKAHPVASEALRAAVGTGSSLGDSLVSLMTLVFVVSALGAMTGSILTGARVPYAMAKDGLFFPAFARVSAAARVPAVSIAVQGLVSAILAVSGTFDQLTDAVVFASWIFYGLTAGALFRLRRRGIGGPTRDLPFRVPLYPVLPIVFIALAAVLLVNTIVTAPVLTALGLGVMLIGLPVYAWLRRSS